MDVFLMEMKFTFDPFSCYRKLKINSLLYEHYVTFNHFITLHAAFTSFSFDHFRWLLFRFVTFFSYFITRGVFEFWFSNISRNINNVLMENYFCWLRGDFNTSGLKLWTLHVIESVTHFSHQHQNTRQICEIWFR